MQTVLEKKAKIIPVDSEHSAIFQSGVQFCQAEGILPAPESNHAIAATITEALKCKESGESKAIAFNLSGHGHFDVQAYLDYHAGILQSYEYPAEEVAMALAGLPVVNYE